MMWTACSWGRQASSCSKNATNSAFYDAETDSEACWRIQTLRAVNAEAVAAPKHPEWGYGYEAALTNYAFFAHAVLTTDQAVKAMEQP